MELNITPLVLSTSELAAEIAEHKGIGHPDTVCDALAERFSVGLCHFYMHQFDGIFHHNVDKALLWGGASKPAFGGGEITAPIEIYLSGRATREVNGVIVPVEEIMQTAAMGFLREEFRWLDPEKHIKLHCLVRPGSADLVELYKRQAKTGEWLANDTSIGAGFAPLSDLEKAVLAASKELRAAARDPLSPEVGEDIKVMGVRAKGRIRLTVACAFVGRHLESLEHYVERARALRERVRAAASAAIEKDIEVRVNTGDNPAQNDVYLTVTGTSAEAGDDGQVGRGNRVNGLITPYRPMTLEAAAGKNPVSHVGKLYNLMANRVAHSIVEALPEVLSAHCYLVSRIGHPVRDPELADVHVRTKSGKQPAALAAAIQGIVLRELEQFDDIKNALLQGRISVY